MRKRLEKLSLKNDIRIIAEPGKYVTWPTFVRDYPPFSIALDGIVVGPTRVLNQVKDPKHGPKVNLNHHEGLLMTPVAVRATCHQALVLVGDNHIYDFAFRKNDRPYALLYVNDNDFDVALATFILKYPSLVQCHKLYTLGVLEDRIDTSSVMFIPDKDEQKLMPVVAWINEPYSEMRQSGDFRKATAQDLLDVIEEMHARIDAYLIGKEKRTPVNERYETVVDCGFWRMIRERGPYSRIRLAKQGISAYVIIKAEGDGRWDYSIGRASLFVPFPLGDIYAACNAAEGIVEGGLEHWGGSSNRGGSPRISGSHLPPEELVRIIRECIQRYCTEAHMWDFCNK